MTLPSLIMALSMVYMAQNMSFSLRISATLCLTSLLLASIPLISKLDTEHSLLPFLLLCLLVLFLGALMLYLPFLGLFLNIAVSPGFTVAILQSSIFGLAGLLPARYTQAVMSGNGFAVPRLLGIRFHKADFTSTRASVSPSCGSARNSASTPILRVKREVPCSILCCPRAFA
jgi:hypothetical protein